jgi:hypothetical protein
MPGFFKAATIVMSGGAIVGAGVLAMLPDPEEPSPPLSATEAATGPLPRVSPAPCQRSLWPNTDGACQTWTLPQRDVEGLLPSEPMRADKSRDLRSVHGSVRGRTARAENIRGKRARVDSASRKISGALRTTAVPQPGMMLWAAPHQEAFRPAYPRGRNEMTRPFAFFGSPAR